MEAKRANAIREPKKILPQGPDESVAEYDDKEPDDSIAKYDDTEEETPRKKRGRARQRAGGTMADWRKVRLGIRLLFGGLGVFVGLLILVLAFLVLILVNPGKLLQLSWGKLIGLPLCFLFGYQSLIFAGSGFLLFAPVRHGAKRLARVFFGVTAVTWALSLLALVFIMLPLMKAVSDVQQSVDQNAKNVDESLKILQANRPGARLTPEQEARMKEAARKLEAQADEWRKRVEESRRKLEEDMKKAQPSPPPTSQGARFVGTIVAISVVALLYLASVLLVCLQPFLFRALARNLRADELNESCLEFMKLSLSAVCFSTLLRAVLSTLSGTLGAVSFLATMVDWVLILVNLSLFVWYYRLLFRLHGAIGDHLGGR